MNFIKPIFNLQLFFFLLNLTCIPLQLKAFQAKKDKIPTIILDVELPKKVSDSCVFDISLHGEGLIYMVSSSDILIYNGSFWYNIFTGERTYPAVNDSGNLHFLKARAIDSLDQSAFTEEEFFRYRLFIGDTWSEWKNGSELMLEDLEPGDYELSIRFVDNDGKIAGSETVQMKVRDSIYLSWIAIILYIFLGLGLVFFIYKRVKFFRLRQINEDEEKVRVEAYHREEPWGNLIDNNNQEPKETKRKTKWDKYEMVTVLFSDIQGFTRIAEQMNPELLVDELDRFFFHFDSVVERYNIEKIKTIGDAYMAAGGIPKKNRSNPVEVVLAALEMQNYMTNLQKTKVDFWDLRIGIHTGPVIAGIIGQKKRSYDIWGDTVNTASRMESSGEPGKVNISGETYALVKDYFICEYRGKLPVKYKGNLDMYFIKGLRPELSINLAGIPNRKFFLKLQLLRLADLEDHVFGKLDDESPATFHYHTPEQSRHQYDFAELLAKAENLDMEETLLVRTAVLILPLGYLHSYTKPEVEASILCEKLLPDYQYSQKQIRSISNLLLASKWPPDPITLLEKVMVDVRMEYLGRADYKNLQRLLFLEKNDYDRNLDDRDWKKSQIELLQNFKFFTRGARRMCEVSFDEQIQKLQRDAGN